jgi:hypothetical protein
MVPLPQAQVMQVQQVLVQKVRVNRPLGRLPALLTVHLLDHTPVQGRLS